MLCKWEPDNIQKVMLCNGPQAEVSIERNLGWNGWAAQFYSIGRAQSKARQAARSQVGG